MPSPNPRTYISLGSKPGGWYSVEDFLNELSVLILASSTIKALSVAVVDSDGNQVTSFGPQAKPATSAVTQVASSASSVTLLAANTARLGATIFNDSTQAVFVKFGTTASSTSFTIKMASASYFEVPNYYTGRIDGIWVSAQGNAYVTELTA